MGAHAEMQHARRPTVAQSARGSRRSTQCRQLSAIYCADMRTHDTQMKSSGALPAATSNGHKLSDPGLEVEWDQPLALTGEARYSQSLERGLAILECFTPERPLQGIAELADALGMSRSTTHRYVITLVALGYLRQGERRKYRLALRVTDLGL